MIAVRFNEARGNFMIKAKHGTAILAITLLAIGSYASTDWDNPADIPTIEPVTVGLAGERPADIVRYLMARGALQTRISPDGQTVAFSYRVTGEPQLWVVAAAGGWPMQLTFGSAITFFRWSPDGKHLLVGRDHEGNEREGYTLLSVDGTRERQLLPRSDAFRVFGMFSADGSQILFSSTERTGRDFDIYVTDVQSGDTRIVFEGTFGFFPQAWQPGGDLVIVTETRGEDANDLHILNMVSGEMTPLFQPEVAAFHGSFAWLPDGSGFYLATNQDREFVALAFYSIEDKKLTFLETPDADVSNVTLSGDGRYLAWTTNEDGYSKIHVMNRNSKTTLTPPEFPGGVHSLEFSAAASALKIRITGPGIPGDVYVWNVASDDVTRAVESSLAGLDRDTFVVPESLRYPARDGVELQGLLYRPNDSVLTGKPPVLVKVHGGPTAQARPTFQPQVQYLVNNGIAVFDVNVRGSTGFGKTYARLDNQEKRLDSVRDLVDTVAFLSQDERLNTNRIAVMGGSYGGYMVNAVLGTYPGVFDAGVSRVGVSDWVRALQEASPGLKASDRIEYGDIREEKWQEFYRVNSPINNAHKINVPLLVQHGVNDPRDPVTESDRLVTKIRDAGGTVTYMRFPDEGHGLAKQANRVAYFRNLASFLEQHLKPSEQGATD
jgi:dipeptidyl aminopeptidase/acylaminoacyl peptidase